MTVSEGYILQVVAGISRDRRVGILETKEKVGGDLGKLDEGA